MENKKILWTIQPLDLPVVIKSCSKCADAEEFECSKKFRINANHNRLDVWLIYSCKKCKTTWNMEIYSRISPKTLDSGLYERLMANDEELAAQYAFDLSLLRKNSAVVSFENIPYEIKTDNPLPETGKCLLEISCPCPMGIRMDKLLSTQLNVSREKIKRLCKSSAISCPQSSDLARAKCAESMLLQLDMDAVHS